MTEKRLVAFPAQYRAETTIENMGFVRQILEPESVELCDINPFTGFSGRHLGEIAVRANGRMVLVIGKASDLPSEVPDGVIEVLIAKDGVAPVPNTVGRARWLIPTLEINSDALAWENRAEESRISWHDRITLKEEIRENGNIIQRGLRSPQLGAVYAVLAHKTVSNDPATVVMPTGTGKTETMLTLVAKEQLKCVLVVVPSVALREQISKKFETWGVLRDAEIIAPEADYPVVGVLEHIPATPESVHDFFRRCNVVIANIQTVGQTSDEVRSTIASAAAHLFVDEAHHITATTWSALRRAFDKHPVIQFTATPFRRDRKHVDGRVIYNYPLRRAQTDEYFRTIEFQPIVQYDQLDSDIAIAETAITRLENDLANGFDHIIMARVDNIERAGEILQIYLNQASAYAPVTIHSKLSKKEKIERLSAIRTRSSRIVVCVDMLGEGFDLPSLKIAALHDAHKSLAITLQFIGRFTRTTSTVGNATVIANIANSGVEKALRELYAEDADWNQLLQQISTGATGRQAAQAEFLSDFGDLPPEVPLQNLIPKMSTVVYKTTGADWNPEAINTIIGPDRLYGQPAINHNSRIAVFITRERDEVEWGEIRELVNTNWELFVIHWDKTQKLLFIHSSDKSGAHQALASAIVSSEATLIDGENVFRAMAGITRLTIQNVGLSDAIGRNRKFTMLSGVDVSEGLSAASLASKIKTNAFGRGYEHGSRVSIGASRKGRLWSHWRAASLVDWRDWCHMIGTKLLNDEISTEQVFSGTLLSKLVVERPKRTPIAMDWGEDVWRYSDQNLEVIIAGQRIPLLECDLELLNNDETGPIRFYVKSEKEGHPIAVEFEIVFSDGAVEYRRRGLTDGEVVTGRGRKMPLSAWFQSDPPAVRFSDTSYLEYNRFYDIRRDPPPPYPKSSIVAWDWTNVDITVESQMKGVSTKNDKSIQFRVIQSLLAADHLPNYEIIFDDDASGEIADIVALAVQDGELLVHLYHCKFSGGDTPAGRVKDLYEVCGQAQRSISWKSRVERLFERLPRREARRRKQSDVSRFEKGDLKALSAILAQLPELRPVLKVFIVQPGLSRTRASDEQLKLLAATELYLKETLEVSFTVIASE